MERYFKVEGNIIYPDMQMLTWGPFYYHSIDKAKEKMKSILENITKWCNLQDPNLNILPTDMVKVSDGTQISFKIKAWKNETTLSVCNGIIEVEGIFFEDEKTE